MLTVQYLAKAWLLDGDPTELAACASKARYRV